MPPGEFEQRWFVKAVNPDSLISSPSNYTEWIYVDQLVTPEEFKLFSPFPNPMQDAGNIRYQLSEEAGVNIQLYDLLGRKIKQIDKKTQPAGNYTEEWNSNGISSGIYIIRITATTESGSTYQKSVMVSVIK